MYVCILCIILISGTREELIQKENPIYVNDFVKNLDVTVSSG